ncbi:MAG: hypothetical protein L0I84_01075 [Halomonas subglaciescola]|nr:hypothetical protein [Halomonas subglaciescola]
MPAKPMPIATSPRLYRRGSAARWWLAGLLVSCLLPVSLHTPEAARSLGRCVYAAVWAPAILRAQSRRFARRSPTLRHAGKRCRYSPAGPRSRRARCLRLVAALDVVSRRGPPSRA